MLALLFLVQTASAKSTVADAVRLVNSARTLTVTMLSTTEEFPRDTRVRYSFKKGGYFRAQGQFITDVGNPQKGWTADFRRKIYQERAPLRKDFDIAPVLGLDILAAGLPIIGTAKRVTWHKKEVLRVELDARKRMTKETKLFAFFDPKSHLPFGISANLGSITQVTVFENLRVNAPIEAKLFTFAAPKGWKRVTASTGGWR